MSRSYEITEYELCPSVTGGEDPFFLSGVSCFETPDGNIECTSDSMEQWKCKKYSGGISGFFCRSLNRNEMVEGKCIISPFEPSEEPLFT